MEIGGDSVEIYGDEPGGRADRIAEIAVIARDRRDRRDRKRLSATRPLQSAPNRTEFEPDSTWIALQNEQKTSPLMTRMTLIFTVFQFSSISVYQW